MSRQGISDLIAQPDRHAVVIDIYKNGRQDMMALAYGLAKDVDSDAVYVVSNPKVAREAVFALEARGIAAFWTDV